MPAESRRLALEGQTADEKTQPPFVAINSAF